MARKRKSPSSATAGVDEAAAAGTNTADEPSSQDHDEAMQTVPEMRPADALEGGAADAGQQPAGRGGRTHNGGAATPPRARVEASPPRRLLVILHGKRAQDKEVAAAIEAVRAAGHTVDVRVTFEAGDVEKIVWDALRRSSGTAGAAREMSHPNAAPPYETLVAAGGDGTLNEVVAAVVSGGAAGRQGADKCPSVALLPLGTSNDFAATTGVPADLTQALMLAADASRAVPVDVGFVQNYVARGGGSSSSGSSSAAGGGGGSASAAFNLPPPRLFINTATLGASAELGSETAPAAKQLLGPAAYLVRGIRKLVYYSPVPAVLTYPAAAATTGDDDGDAAAAEDEGETAAATASASAPAAAAAAAGEKAPPPTGESRDALAAAAAMPLPPEASADSSKKRALLGSGKRTGSGYFSGVLPALRSSGSSLLAAGLSGGSKRGQRGASASPPSDAARIPTTITKERVELLTLTAGNNRQVASLLAVCPDALLDDGLLDVCFLTGSPADQVSELAAELVAAGGSLEEAVAPADIHTLRVPWIEVQTSAAAQPVPAEDNEKAAAAAAAGAAPSSSAAAAPDSAPGAELPDAAVLPANADGELVEPSNRFRLWVEPRRIRLHLPDDRLLVRGVAAGGSEDGAACGSGGALPAAAAGPIGNRHGHHHMAMGPLPPHRRGLIKTMITSVRRFKRARPDSEPGLVGSLARSAARGVALLFGGFAVGYLTAWREAQQAGFAAAASS